MPSGGAAPNPLRFLEKAPGAPEQELFIQRRRVIRLSLRGGLGQTRLLKRQLSLTVSKVSQ